MIEIEVNFEGVINSYVVTEKHSDPDVPKLDIDFIPSQDVLAVDESLQEKKGHTFVYGGTGLGKTESAMFLAALRGIKVFYISMNGETTPDNFLGYKTAVNGTIHYRNGKLLKAMAGDAWLIVDELDYGVPPLLSVLNMALAQGFYSVDDTGKTIEAGPNFRVFATANTNGSGDETGLYPGTNPMNRALLDRFKSTIEYSFPTPEKLEKILQSRVSKTYDFSKVIQLSSEVLKAIREDQVYMTWGVRSVVCFAEKMVMYGHKRSAWDLAKRAFANNLDSASKAVMESLVVTVFG